MLTLFFWMLVGHGVADYPLQGDFMAKGKNHTAPLPGVPWEQCLFWHAMIHAGFVALVTGSVACGLAELVAHMFIDYAKCNGELTFRQDQFAHVLCKVYWAAWMVPPGWL